jgi:hypothetical protein
LLAHNIIPHHHPEQASPHHTSDHHHHHSNDPDAKSDQDTTNPLEYFSHAGTGVEFKAPSGKIDCSLLASLFVVSSFAVQFHQEIESPPDRLGGDELQPLPRFTPSSHGLRAPPVA